MTAYVVSPSHTLLWRARNSLIQLTQVEVRCHTGETGLESASPAGDRVSSISYAASSAKNLSRNRGTE